MRRIKNYIPAGRPRTAYAMASEIRRSIASESPGARRVFMSHKTGDYDDASAVGHRLASAGLSVYFVEDDPAVRPGDHDHLPAEIKDAVRRSAGLLVYASDRLVAGDASWVCFEVGLADMRGIATARYTVTSYPTSLLSPIRGLEAVERSLGSWVNRVKYS